MVDIEVAQVLILSANAVMKMISKRSLINTANEYEKNTS